MKKFYLSAILIIAMGATACSSKDDAPDEKIDVPFDEIPLTPDDVLGNGEFSNYSKIELGENGKAIVDGENDFSIELFKGILNSRGRENTLFSPFNTYMQLAMISNGDTGKTKEEITNLLCGENPNLSAEELYSYAKTMLKRLPELDTWARFNMASSIWHAEKTEIHDGFFSDVNNIFGTDDRKVNPTTPNGMEEINKWVNANTYGLIPQFLHTPLISEPALITASCFIGRWNPSDEFNPEYTKTDVFTNLDGTQGETSFMNAGKIDNYFNHKGIEGICLDFGGGNYSYYAFMPENENTFNGMIESLDRKNLNDLISSGEIVNLKISLPKYEVKNDIDLNQVLRDKGLSHLFTTGLNRLLNNGKNAPVEICMQSNVLSLDEKGVKAAAVDLMMVGSNNPAEMKEVIVKFNQPFVYLIRENSTGTILFIGAMTHS